MLLLPLPWIHSRWKGFYAESLHCFLRIQVRPRWSSYWEAMLLISLWCATVVRGWTTMSLRQWCRVGAGIFRRQSFLRFIDGGRYDFPFYGIVLCYLCVQCRECQRRVCIRAIEVYPENFHIWLNFIFAKITDFAFRINKKGYICMMEIENSRVIGIECFWKMKYSFVFLFL